MVYKIYKSNNYIVVIDENDNYFEEHCATVLVTKNLTPDTTYTVTFFRPENTPQAFYNIPFADIRQQSGAPYASVAAWETWYTTNTGLCNNTAVLNSILATLQAQTDVEGVFVKDLGNSDKIVLQVKVWDQDSQTYIATYYYNPDGSLYTPVGPLEWVGTAGSVNATIVNPLGDITACSDAVAVTLCSGQATELFDQGITLDNILTELTTGTLDVNITNTTLAVTQSGVWNINAIQSGTWTVALDTATLTALETITVNQGTNPWVVSGTVALDAATLTALETINAVQSGTWTVGLDAATLAALENITVTGTVAATQSGAWAVTVLSLPAITGTVALDAATLAALENITVSGTVAATQSGTWTVGVNSLPAISGTVSVTQPTHDLLNANANIQVNNTDVSATNPVPVLQQYPGTVPYASCEVATGTGTTPVVFSAGATSMSVQNIGNDNITVDTDASSGVILPPGVSITWDAPVGQRFDTFTFTGSSVSSLFIVTAVIAS